MDIYRTNESGSDIILVIFYSNTKNPPNPAGFFVSGRVPLRTQACTVRDAPTYGVGRGPGRTGMCPRMDKGGILGLRERFGAIDRTMVIV